jgi:hypothetical protein
LPWASSRDAARSNFLFISISLVFSVHRLRVLARPKRDTEPRPPALHPGDNPVTRSAREVSRKILVEIQTILPLDVGLLGQRGLGPGGELGLAVSFEEYSSRK